MRTLGFSKLLSQPSVTIIFSMIKSIACWLSCMYDFMLLSTVPVMA